MVQLSKGWCSSNSRSLKFFDFALKVLHSSPSFPAGACPLLPPAPPSPPSPPAAPYPTTSLLYVCELDVSLFWTPSGSLISAPPLSGTESLSGGFYFASGGGMFESLVQSVQAPIFFVKLIVFFYLFRILFSYNYSNH